MRFIDDLENSPASTTPSPAEVEAILRHAEAMRHEAMARHIASIWTLLGLGATPKRRERAAPTGASPVGS
ncbi:MAG: hypothetical protein AAF899_15020 [Pseudomonadota bacterium]